MKDENNNKFFDRYERAGDFMKKLCGSGLRTKILISLTREPMRLYEISGLIDTKRQNVSLELRELQRMRLVESEIADNANRFYSLTVSGEIVKNKIIDLLKFLDNSESNNWFLNQFTDIPDMFIYELELLINSRKIKNDGSNLLDNQSIFNCDGDLKLIIPVFNRRVAK